MRRYILLTLLLSCLHIATRGQTIADIDLSGLPEQTQAKSMRYWFDDDDGSVKTISHLNGSKKLDVSSLVDGLHTLHYQVIDNKNAVAYICSSLFLKVGHATTSAHSIRYWFDDEKSSSTTIAANNGFQSVSTASLMDGIHTIHYQVMGSNGQAYYIASGIFFKSGSGEDGNVTAKQLMYWFDDETSIHKIDMSSGVQMIDASSLMEGLHTLHYQVLCSNGMMTPAQSSVFMRLNFDTETAAAKSLRYWFDNETEVTEKAITQGVQMLDATRLTDGLHTVHYQVVDNRGTLGAPVSSVFMKMITSANSQAKKIRYWFDDDTTTLKVIDVNTGTQQIDVSNLLTGIHTLYYQLVDGEGKVGVPVAGLFLKNFDKVIEGGVNKITQYQYWLNKNSESMETVKVNNAANPYKLISLLPVQKEPFHSDCFHFEVNDGVPAAYAKNIFHIRFHDAQGYFSDKDAPFIDYSVKQEVSNPKLLTSGKRETTARPQENEIKWYKLEAEPGDSVQFKLDRACSMQLFSPSGKEIHAVSGSESVEWNGLHVFENGTYYLALHDMTATNGNQLNLDYEHIDKYAVLRYSPEEVGVFEGNFYIKLFGNGYNQLIKAQLVKANHVLTAELIQVRDLSNAILQFSFNDNNYTRGYYDLVLEFSDGTKNESLTVAKAVNIANPIFGEITVDVSSRRTVAMPYPVTVKINNTGNVTYQFVPLYFANSINNLESVHLLDFNLQSNKNVMDAGIKTFYKVDNLFGEDSCIVVPTIIPVVNPYESLEFNVGFVTGPHATFNMYSWTETPWSMRGVNVSRVMGAGLRKAPTTNITCEMDPCDLVSFIPNSGCVCEVLWGGVSAVANAYGAANQWRNNQLRNTYGQWYEDNGVEWPYRDIPVKIPADIIDQVLRECVGEIAPDELSHVQEATETALEMMRGRDAQDCPPPPPPTRVDPYMPGDPNEIYGYTSESGSKYVPKGIRDVYFDIEFENDSTIANAAAHHIVVKDTLNAKLFDLSTFTPTSISLGSKKITLNGEQNFLVTVDLRPSINVIAQIQLKYDKQKGIATWDILSLDPMTMEQTDDAMQGILPVNFDGNGIGEVSFDIKLKPGLADGTLVPNRAGIVFDHNDVIMTPAWENIIDLYAPESHVTEVIIDTDTTALVKMEATDNLSGVWKYDVYVQYGEGAAWFPEALDVPADQMARVRYYEGVETRYLTVAYDMAGNKEFRQVLNPEMGTATGIADIEHSDNGRDSYYDLQGRKMTKKPQRGIFIRNKKKYVAQ